MALDFPDEPTIGAVHSSGQFAWKWDGTRWVHYVALGSPSFGVSLGHTVAQPIPNNTATAVIFDTEYYDAASYHSAGGSRITIPTGHRGRYLVGFTSSFPPVAGGTVRNGWIRKNGGVSDRIALSLGYPSASYAGQMQGTATLDLNDGDYIEHMVQHDQGAAQSLQGNNTCLLYTSDAADD